MKDYDVYFYKDFKEDEDFWKKCFEATYNTDKRVNATLKKVYFNKDYSIKGIDVNYTFVGGFKGLEK